MIVIITQMIVKNKKRNKQIHQRIVKIFLCKMNKKRDHQVLQRIVKIFLCKIVIIIGNKIVKTKNILI